jgi:hypothetical protein
MPELLTAYKNADYVVFGEPELVLRIGEPSARMDSLLETLGAPCAAFVTAANPRGERRAESENVALNESLFELVDAAGYPRYEGEGRDPDGSWAEPSTLIVGIFRDNAEALGRLFSQNAIVFIEKGKAPELVVLKPKPAAKPKPKAKP